MKARLGSLMTGFALALASAGWVHALDGQTALVNAQIIDGRGNPPVQDRTILIDDGTRKWVASQNFDSTDPDGDRYGRLFATMAEADIILQPALLADIDLPGRHPGPPPSANPPEGAQGRPPRPAWMKDMADWACELTRAAHRAGVTIAAGTDTFGNKPFLSRELSRLVECGLTPLDAIQSATYHNALAMGLEQEIGSVEKGKRANLVVVDGDPTEDIQRIGDVHMVVKDGHVIEASGASQ